MAHIHAYNINEPLLKTNKTAGERMNHFTKETFTRSIDSFPEVHAVVGGQLKNKQSLHHFFFPRTHASLWQNKNSMSDLREVS